MESLKDIFQYIELRKTENTKVFSVTPFKTSLKVDFGQKTPPYALFIYEKYTGVHQQKYTYLGILGPQELEPKNKIR